MQKFFAFMDGVVESNARKNIGSSLPFHFLGHDEVFTSVINQKDADFFFYDFVHTNTLMVLSNNTDNNSANNKTFGGMDFLVLRIGRYKSDLPVFGLVVLQCPFVIN